MKLESDSPFHHSTTSLKCVPESHECNYKTLELQTQATKEKQIKLSCEEKMNRRDANQSPYYGVVENGCINCSSIDDFDDNADGMRAFVAPSSEKPSDSKPILCYKEINVNDVKDICIDERVVPVDSIFFGSMDEKPVCKILPHVDDQNKGFIDDLKFSVENHFGKDLTIGDDSKDLKQTQIEKAKLNDSDSELPKQESTTEGYPSGTFDNLHNEVAITGVQISSENANLEPASVSKSVEPCNGNTALDSEAELPNDISLTTNTSEVGNDGIITLNFKSSVNGGEEHHGNANLNYSIPTASSAVTEECCQSSVSAVGTQVSTNLEVGPSLVPSQTQHDVGESSFSIVDPLSSLMNYTGPVAYSGSISLRSESSAASTRSFAFPILQSEWNSSPVKMAKAERRHYRKYRGWREGLLCCRF